jgi:hypothetical protein
MKRIVKVNKFNLSDIVADYEEIVSTRYFTIIKCEIKALSCFLQNPLGSLYFTDIYVTCQNCRVSQNAE